MGARKKQMNKTEKKLHQQYRQKIRSIKARLESEKPKPTRAPVTADQMAEMIAKALIKVYGQN